MRRAVLTYGLLVLLVLLSCAGASSAMLSLQFASFSPTQGPLLLYQRFFAHLDGRPCPSSPVCSLYARQALALHGPLVGSWLMIDRLIHEADDVRRGPWMLAVDGKRLYDPLMRNDFWLDQPHRE